MGDVLDIVETARKHNLRELPSRELVRVPTNVVHESAWSRMQERVSDWLAESLLWCIIAAIIVMFLIALLAVFCWFVYVGASVLILGGHGWLVYSPLLIGVGWWVGRRGPARQPEPTRSSAPLYVVTHTESTPPPAA